MENSLFVKMLLLFVGSLHLQNETNADHMQLEALVQWQFKQVPIKIFNTRSRKFSATMPNFAANMW